MSQSATPATTSTVNATDLAGLLKDYVPLADYNAALDSLNEVTEDRDRLRTEGEASIKRTKELEGKVRSRAYRDAYDKVRKDAKVKDEFADDVFRLLDLKQDSDEPDEGAIRKALDAFAKDRKQYLDTEAPRPEKKTLTPGEGHSRGGSTRPGEPEFRVTNAQLKDAGWMRDNQGKMLEAKRAGLLVLEDEV